MTMLKIQCIPLLIILIIADDKEGNKTMDNQQIRNFYLSKEHVPTPETDRLIAGEYMQKSDAYIEVRQRVRCRTYAALASDPFLE